MSLTALYTGLTGLNVSSASLDVTGNNLANLNTSGYKTQQLGFKDLLYQTINGGSAPSGGLGGTNPTQIGFGVAQGAINSLFTQGTVTPTGRSLDAAIQGSGFFVLSNGQNEVYSRAGSFNVDANGFLIDPNTGAFVQRTGTLGEGSATTPGFQVSGNQNIRIPFGSGLPGLPTTNVSFQGNLSSSLPVGGASLSAIQVYDTLSAPHPLTVTFTKTAVGTFDATATISGGTATVTGGPITFDSSGLLVGPATLSVAVTGIAGAAPQTITLNLGTPGQATGLTQFGGASTATAVTQDGVGAGTLQSVEIGRDGTISGLFSNGRTAPVAQLAIAGFNNESGLLRVGNNYYVAGPASGEALIGPGGQGGRGVLQGGAIEGSNVDIATEFGQLIIAQRTFQANAQTITTANQLLAELGSIIR
ncbi:flagellar hook protein : Flagellar hook-basal body protein OS=Cellulomonas fimi (strain ATCC 484 / DSM 20113 / JCM 1341 / NBRC 15513 / NCIMB 8980 / NCTC 7547) GN=Celf_0679 PE=4 SV=1: Flg_bb_rod: FlaE: Flg_bbr_C [Gemmataceae bacterium]|nr:flagellar hook protein : Flagellar hook-basal body protein OS=Cellulomonas fimi (strain ATCC 484 / DSM 20113 / JCM 1341 / NBRC 15513 / NCIMB 8980 / NCTC 7547) GN=Celf_0679 PE=4 SV=1: Flg_bb_rod: FlaE: Flg_bbr_C [Gemmataceae bacterium]VTT97915.1 flagellar hook protein : Flagellar hook-basal body protein OS=Cellulomonas fimi (strain ATCC 484 / DSM 20113 / JCM 1341 / NBRC 15513 / NCIMB 8980 / NCTC 7547) GN=Celf_0679 PE=4 SV=1: Flg_bb_rod: FlaE: Flg_bbr_C [Gemmataceae bacterium]